MTHNGVVIEHTKHIRHDGKEIKFYFGSFPLIRLAIFTGQRFSLTCYRSPFLPKSCLTQTPSQTDWEAPQKIWESIACQTPFQSLTSMAMTFHRLPPLRARAMAESTPWLRSWCIQTMGTSITRVACPYIKCDTPTVEFEIFFPGFSTSYPQSHSSQFLLACAVVGKRL